MNDIESLSQNSQEINTAIAIEKNLTESNTVLGVDVNNINKPDLNDEKVQHHKIQFENWLQENYETGNTSFVLKKKDYDEIKDVLRGVKTLKDHNKKYAFKKKKYLLIDNVVHRLIDNRAIRVAYLEEFFEIIYVIHCIERIHQGIQKTFDQIVLRYVGITREIVSKFREFCYVCDLKTSQRTQDRLLPIRSQHLFERTQIDMIDMRNCPDGDYKWICHVVDHNSHFHAAWPQKTKEGN